MNTWIKASVQLPDHAQYIVKGWKNGNVWAGWHNPTAKNESFDWWMPVPTPPGAAFETERHRDNAARSAEFALR